LSLNPKQQEFLKNLADKLSGAKTTDRDQIQKIILTVLKEGNFKPKEIFPGFYQALTGKSYGPNAADLILDSGIDSVIKRIQQSTNPSHPSGVRA
jgi:lysyl-tRNA synthetase class I